MDTLQLNTLLPSPERGITVQLLFCVMWAKTPILLIIELFLCDLEIVS